MRNTLSEQLTVAREARATAQATLSTLQEAQAECREHAARAHEHLVRIRRHLRALLGGSHREYRRLMPTTRSGEPADLAEVVDISAVAATNAPPAEAGDLPVEAELPEVTGVFDLPTEAAADITG